MRTSIALLLAGCVLASSGQAQFVEHPIERCDSHEPFCVRAGDLDSDGDMDLVAMSAKDDRLLWYANDGGGSFGPVSIIHQGTGNSNDRFMQFEIADMDGDLDLDVVAFWEEALGGLSLHRNLGDGSFAPRESIGPVSAFFSDFYSIALDDINGDGTIDVLAGDDSSIRLFVNDGAGDFTWLAFPNGSSHPVSLRTGDLDDDGDNDLLFGSTDDAYRSLNDGQGNFSPGGLFSTGLDHARAQIHCDDLNGDGSLDVLYVRYDELRWKANDGTGGFGSFSEPGALIGPQAALISYLNTADLDGDGDQDVVTSDYGTDGILWYANNGTGVFGEPTLITDACPGVYTFDTADLDGDGAMDLAVAATDGAFIGWLPNAGAGIFAPLVVLDRALNTPITLAFGDLDGDADTDLSVASSKDGKLAWYPAISPGVFDAQRAVTSGLSQGSGATLADLDGDGDLDMLTGWTDLDFWVDPSYEGLAWYANDGTGTYGPMQPMLLPEVDMNGVEAADINGDGDVDVIGFWNDHITPALNNGSGTFVAADPIAVLGSTTSGHAMGDLDDDGDLDILVVLDEPGNAFHLYWLENEDGAFAQEVVIDTEDLGHSFRPGIADVDGDGDPDILGIRDVPGKGAALLTTYLNGGSGAFGQPIEQVASASIDHVLPADLDADGDVDEVVALYDYQSPTGYFGRLVWKANDGSGAFGPEQTVVDSLATISTMAALDIDGDLNTDIVAGGEASCWLSWFKNPGVSTALLDHQTSVRLSLAPNPCGDHTRLFSDAPLTPQHRIVLVDACGRGQANITGTGGREMVIPTAALPPGVYALQVRAQGNTLGTARLVRELAY